MPDVPSRFSIGGPGAPLSERPRSRASYAAPSLGGVGIDLALRRTGPAYPSLVDVLGNARCAGCGQRLGPLCAPCHDRIRPAFSRSAPHPARRLICRWPYEGAVRSLVISLKARAVRHAAVPLVDAMTEAVWATGLAGTVITWVPGRPAEERKRGFDHAHLLAAGLGRRLGLPVVRLLERAGRDRDQVGLSAEERRRNLEGTFRPLPEACPKGVVLVDDVLTTGATASACAQALLEGGAAAVELVVACSAE